MSAVYVALGLLVCASAVRDVPKGYCHDCEVTCFEDCVLKFDREIITPDLTDKARLSRKDTRVEAAMKKKMAGVVLAQNATDVDAKEMAALKDSYSTCLKKDSCPCAHDDKKKKTASFLAAVKGKKKCQIAERPCAVGCVGKTVDGPAALVQTAGKVKPGPADPDDAAIPWSINIHPVKINTFATGRQNLERCFKSCLAATCGCEDAPGMEAIEDMNDAIKANDMAKDPVDDSSPMWQFKPADIVDCGKGMQGKKVTKDLYAQVGGSKYVEVCSDEFFTEVLGTPADVGKKSCTNAKALLGGCLWDTTVEKCVYGLKKTVHCSSRYHHDTKL